MTTLALIHLCSSLLSGRTWLHGLQSSAKCNYTSWNYYVRYSSIWYGNGDSVRRIWKWDTNFILQRRHSGLLKWVRLLPFIIEDKTSWRDVVAWIYLELQLKENNNDVWKLAQRRKRVKLAEASDLQPVCKYWWIIVLQMVARHAE